MGKLNDFYCSGYFGRRYDLNDAEVIAESAYTITIKTLDGDIDTVCFYNIEDTINFKKEYVQEDN